MKKIILWAAAFSLMALIFCFSAQPQDKSNSTSLTVTEKVVNILPQTKNLEAQEKVKIVTSWNGAIRKYAHFSLYLLLGAALFLAFHLTGKSAQKAWLFALAICLCYAALDEAHQMFVPGRGPQLRDVGIDFCGALLSGTLLAGVFALRQRLRKK